MGAVYRATHTLMGKPCAIKVLRGPGAVIKQAAKRFQREAQSASRLDHDHCIRVTDFGIAKISGTDLMYLVMELLEGRSLADELAALGALPLDRLLHIAAQVAAALVHAHALGIVHRDLKPDNIFLVKRGGDPDFVKVLDFGLAKILDDRSDGKMATLSEAGTVFGTPEYMAPEQAEGKPLDHRADLYSFGVVLYHMMTGQLPFQGASLVAILTKHLTESPMSPALRRPDLELPPELVGLCLRCLEKTPDARPSSADVVLAVLRGLEPSSSAPPPRVPALVASHPTVDIGPAALPSRPPSLSPLSHSDDLEPPTRRRAGLYAVLLAPLVVAAGIVTFVILRDEPRSPSEPPGATGNHALPRPSTEAQAQAPVLAAADAATPAGPAARTTVGSPAPPEGQTVKPATPPATPTAPAGPTAATHLREAEAFAARGNHLKELFHLQQAVRLEPGNAQALFLLGRSLLEDGQAALGCEKLGRARELGNKSAESLYQSATCEARPPH